MPHCSIVTTCKGYRRHLEKTLPAMLAQQCPPGWTFDVIVIDYQCPDGTLDWMRETFSTPAASPLPTITAAHRLRGVQVLDAGEFFNGCRARNIGIAHTRSDLVFCNDADDMPPPNAMRDGIAAIEKGAALVNWVRDFSHRGGPKNSCFGAAMFSRETWAHFRGYDESLGTLYGYSDSDFYRRVRNDSEYAELPADGWQFVPRTEDEASRFHELKDFEESKRENARRIHNRRGVVNPNGYGDAQLRLWSALPERDGWMSWSELAWLEDRASQRSAIATADVEDLQPITWLEVGVYLGRSFHRVGLSLPKGSTLIGVDTFDSRTHLDTPTAPTFARLGAALEDLRSRRPDLELVLTTPAAARRMIPRESVDVLFVDGLHDREHVEQDLDELGPTVKSGGKVAGHDYWRERYPDLCDVIDARFPHRTIQHTIWEVNLGAPLRSPVSA